MSCEEDNISGELFGAFQRRSRYEVCLKSNETVHTILLLKNANRKLLCIAFKVIPMSSNAFFHPPLPCFHVLLEGFFRIARSSFVTALLIACKSGKRVPFMTPLSFGNRKKSQGARSGEYGSCSSTAMLFLARNSRML